MSVVVLLILVSLLVAILFLGAFVWAVKSGQFDDDHSPGVRILFDDKVSEKKEKEDNTPK
jgi:cbb3-type cytochrome oxidase maturation protein